MGPDSGLLPGAGDLTRFWIPIEARTVLRAAWLAGVWAVVAAVLGAVAVAAVALIGAAVSAVVGFFGDSVGLSESTRRTVFVGGGIAACGVVVASTWAGAYASTQEGSRWRMLAGSAVGVSLGLGLVGVGSLGAPAAALAGGWGTAIPADRAGRIALRSLPVALLALLPILQASDGWLEWAIAGAGGIVAAWIWIAVAEGLWAIGSAVSSRSMGGSGIMQNKTQVGDLPGSTTREDNSDPGARNQITSSGSPEASG